MWQRVVHVRLIDNESNETLLDTGGIRIDFNFTHSWGVGDVCSISIYNLPLEIVKSTVLSSSITAELYVGYGEEVVEGLPPLLVRGPVINAIGTVERPHHVTRLFIFPHGKMNLGGNVEVPPMKGNTTVGDYVAHLSKHYSLGAPQWVEGTESIKAKSFKGKSTPATGLHALRMLESQFKIRPLVTGGTDGGKIVVYPDASWSKKYGDTMNSATSVIPMDVVMLKGTPALSAGKIEIPYNMSTGLSCGDIIDTSPFLSADNPINSYIDVSGLGNSLFFAEDLFNIATSSRYQITKIEHQGSNFVDSWQSKISGAMYMSNLKGVDNAQ